MNKKNKTVFKGLGFLTLLLIIRLAFFLRDGTNDTVESILIWSIFFGSFGIFIYAFLYPKAYILYRWIPQLNTIIVGTAIVALDMVFIYKNGMSLDKTYLFSSIFMLYLLFMLASFLKIKVRHSVNVVLLFFVAIYLFLQDLYFQVFNDLFSFKEGGTLREGVESAESMIQLSWYQGLVVITVFAIIFSLRKLPKTHVPSYSFTSKLTSVFLLIALVNLNADYPVKMARLHTSDHYLYSSIYSKKAFVENYGSLNLMIRDLSQTLTPDFSFRANKEYLDAHFNSIEDTHTANEYTGLFKDKNLVYIVGESFDELAVNETLTPNLYKLKHEGWDFENHYAPVFPRTTCDGEVIMNTSLIPSIEDGPTCYTYNTNSYKTSLANQFNKEGYLTQAFHNNYKEFYTRDLVYEGFGYDQLYAQHELGLSEIEKRYDSTFFETSKDTIIPQSEPFFSFMLTLSGHSPYTAVNIAADKHYDIVDAYYGDTYEEVLKYYIASQIELDRLVGGVLDDLEEKGLLEDTVIVLTTDHYPYTLDQSIYEDHKNIDFNYEKAHAPLYIYNESLSPTSIDTQTTSFDILPTLLNLWEIDADYRYYIGNDMFCETASPVYYKDYSVFTGHEYFNLSDSISSTLTPWYERAVIDYDVSKRILRSDYLNTD